jgi:hypothetical protein
MQENDLFFINICRLLGYIIRFQKNYQDKKYSIATFAAFWPVLKNTGREYNLPNLE